MGKIYLLDCTLRDGGYVNDWNFGEQTIIGFSKKIAETGIEIFEVGFMKGDSYNPDKSLFPNTESFKHVIQPKSKTMKYVGMLDMSAPIPLDRIAPYDGTSIDGIRVIFKKNKIDQAYEYCKRIQELGYFISVNIVGTDLYSDKEFIEVIEKFNTLHPFAMSIVDTFGLIKRKHFLRLAYLADKNMEEGVALAYHAHNNLQQAFGNAEALVEMNLKRDIIVDACVFGMGRGAGNLNLELFAAYMNENYDTHYKIEPMLEIMDEYLNDIYRTRFWGYSLPFYLSAVTGSHPNYAIYLAEKNTLTVKAFNELLKGLPEDVRINFSKDNAEKYYSLFQENYIDDKETIDELTEEFKDKKIVLLAPGKSISSKGIHEQLKGAVVIATNFLATKFNPNYIFSSNMRRFSKIQGQTKAKCIITSNMKEATQKDYVVNFSSYTSKNPDIIDNSALMLLRLLIATGVKEVFVAGMDGYHGYSSSNYYSDNLSYVFEKEAAERNALISKELSEISQQIKIHFITNSEYKIEE